MDTKSIFGKMIVAFEADKLNDDEFTNHLAVMLRRANSNDINEICIRVAECFWNDMALSIIGKISTQDIALAMDVKKKFISAASEKILSFAKKL